MTPKELHDKWAADRAQGFWWVGQETDDLAIKGLSLLASVEDGDEFVKSLLDEADLCRNETATDIADMLEKAANAIISRDAQITLDAQEKAALKAEIAQTLAIVSEREEELNKAIKDAGKAIEIARAADDRVFDALKAELASVKADAEKWRAYEERKRRAIDSAYGKLNPLRAAHPKEGA